MGDRTAGAIGTILRIAGVCVLAWAMLLTLTLGASVEGVGASLLFGSYSALLLRAHRRAVVLSWLATLLMAAVAIAEGLGPVLVLVATALFVLSMFVTDVRDHLANTSRRPSRV